MKNILWTFLLLGCMTGREEIQVKSTYATVIEITNISRFGLEDRVVFHLVSENNIRFFLEAPLSDTARYFVGRRYPFLAPR